MDPSTLVQVQDTTPGSRRENGIREDDQGGWWEQDPPSSLTLGSLCGPALVSYGLCLGRSTGVPLAGPGNMVIRQGRFQTVLQTSLSKLAVLGRRKNNVHPQQQPQMARSTISKINVHI